MQWTRKAPCGTMPVLHDFNPPDRTHCPLPPPGPLGKRAAEARHPHGASHGAGMLPAVQGGGSAFALCCSNANSTRGLRAATGMHHHLPGSNRTACCTLGKRAQDALNACCAVLTVEHHVGCMLLPHRGRQALKGGGGSSCSSSMCHVCGVILSRKSPRHAQISARMY